MLTKLDGDTRGGAALSIRSVVDKLSNLSVQAKASTASTCSTPRVWPTVSSAWATSCRWSKAQAQYDEKRPRTGKKLRKNQFTFTDFLKQISQIKKMGNIKDLAAMIPGVGKAIKDVDIDNNAFKGIEAIIGSMTPYEREHPEVIAAPAYSA